MSVIAEIKKLLDSDKLIIGAQRTLKALRAGEIEKVYVAVNPKPELGRDVAEYAKLSDVEVVDTAVPNDELGTLCKKPYPISVIGLRR